MDLQRNTHLVFRIVYHFVWIPKYSYPELKERDQAIIHMQQFSNIEEGKKDWKRSSGYHLRSLVETTMMRFKRTFTDKLRSRRLDTQQAEVYVKCTILNKMIEMGLPYTVPIPYPTC